MPTDYDILEFREQADLRNWLAANHDTVNGIWLRIYKKASATATVTYAEALDEALCFGWIDGQRKSYDEVSFIQKFTPRRARSIWSKRNITYVDRLVKSGQMTEIGLREVERAKTNGRWEAAYDSQADMKVPQEFLDELQKHPEAATFYETLTKSARYSIAWSLHTAKRQETKARRTQQIISLLQKGQKPF